MPTLSTRFPDDIARGAEGGHGGFSTQIVTSAGGLESRNQTWQDAKGRWNVSRAVEAGNKHDLARAWLYKARGRLHTFRFKDWLDFSASRTGTDKGRLTGSVSTWQINKVYGSDDASFEYVRPLKRIVSGTVQIWRNNVLQVITTDYAVNNSTGVVTSTASWAGSTLEVACEFDVLCRFEIDAVNARLVHRKQNGTLLIEWSGIDIVEVRE